jgi:hypothetical protein
MCLVRQQTTVPPKDATAGHQHTAATVCNFSSLPMLHRLARLTKKGADEKGLTEKLSEGTAADTNTTSLTCAKR